MAKLRNHWLEAAWLVFAAVNALFIVLVPTAETIPFHFIWVSLTLLYGLRVWSVPTTAVTTGVVCIVTGVTMGRVVSNGPQGWDELTEVPLMASMFLVMVWHARRRQEALDSMHLTAERERDFVRDASHMLRTPITIAQGHAELLVADLTDETTRTDAGIVLDELRRLMRISDRLLLLAAADNPHLSTLEPVDLADLARRVFERWTPTARRDWRLDVEGPVLVLGDEERLHAALDALIENAQEATSEEQTVRVAAAVQGENGVLEISDSGVGLEPEDLRRVFDRYSRARRGRHTGLGLGLPIVKAIVDAHGGSVAATSDPGKSTTFRIVIPLLRAGRVEPPPAPVVLAARRRRRSRRRQKSLSA